METSFDFVDIDEIGVRPGIVPAFTQANMQFPDRSVQYTIPSATKMDIGLSQTDDMYHKRINGIHSEPASLRIHSDPIKFLYSRIQAFGLAHWSITSDIAYCPTNESFLEVLK